MKIKKEDILNKNTITINKLVLLLIAKSSIQKKIFESRRIKRSCLIFLQALSAIIIKRKKCFLYLSNRIEENSFSLKTKGISIDLLVQ